MTGLPRTWLEHPATIPLLVVGIGTCYLFTLQAGQSWRGDFGLFLAHARNLVEGAAYADTGYLPNSVARFVGPYFYPPVYPLLLAPVYAVFGLDYQAMKALGVLFFCLALLILARLLSGRLPAWQVPLIILLVGSNPYLWQFSNEVGSDLLFMALCYLALQMSSGLFRERAGAPAGVLPAYGLLAGVVFYLAYGTREVGVLLPLALVVHEVLVRRRLSWPVVAAVTAFVLLAWLQGVVLAPDPLSDPFAAHQAGQAGLNVADETTHLSRFTMDLERVARYIPGYRWSMQGFWQYSGGSLQEWLYVLLSNLTMLGALAGFCIIVLRRLSVLEVFCAGYLATHILFDAVPNTRYLVPLFPLALYYFCVAGNALVARFPVLLRWLAGGGYLAATMFLNGAAMIHADTTISDRGVEHPQARAMFEFVSSHTQPDDVIVFRKPRIMALYTRRPSAGLPDRRHATMQLDDYLAGVGADYYVEMDLGYWMIPLRQPVPPGPSFAPVFRNDYFVVYRAGRPASAVTGQEQSAGG